MHSAHTLQGPVVLRVSGTATVGDPRAPRAPGARPGPRVGFARLQISKNRIQDPTSSCRFSREPLRSGPRARKHELDLTQLTASQVDEHLLIYLSTFL